ncbi:hypothetical protein ACFWJ4_38335 [Kitasatospora sp. NPDC127067]|uniref:hypothetical protein n=1 Tax=Kitasatospora sp. NPDC127067 TaxID=3347126 RepID=UPI00365CB3DC
MDLMCLYLLHGSVERIPGLLVDRETLSFEYLSRHVRAENRSGHGDADLFSLWIRTKVRGRLYGLEFRVYFIAGEPCADAEALRELTDAARPFIGPAGPTVREALPGALRSAVRTPPGAPRTPRHQNVTSP